MSPGQSPDAPRIDGGAALRFPRIPERDAKGNAQLYPGFPVYTGIAAIFTDAKLGEVAILAPTVEALDTRVQLFGLTAELARVKCRVARLEPLPNVEINHARERKGTP